MEPKENIRTRLISLGFALFSSPLVLRAMAHLQNAPGPGQSKPNKEADSVKNWDGIYRSFNRFSQCDDGTIAEGYSESVTQLLAEDWKSSNVLLALTNRSKTFRHFVLKRIDNTVPGDGLASIANHPRSKCAPGSRKLCLSIA